MSAREDSERVAIVVGRTDYGDTDRILRLLSPDEGRISVMVRNARKRHPGLEPGARVRVALRHGHGELQHLVRGELEDGRTRLRASLPALTLALYACELCGAFAREGYPETRLYGLLETFLLVLDAAEGEPGPGLLAVLDAKVLTFAGFAPVLDRCAVCGQPPEAPMAYSPSAGGAVHGHCGSGEPVTLAWLRALEAARRRPVAESLDLVLPDDPGELPYVAVREHLGRELPARAVLRVIQAPGLADSPPR